MPSINLTNFENVVAHTISEINSTSGVTNIRNIYANQSDIIDLLNNKADQVDTYTKAQIDANFPGSIAKGSSSKSGCQLHLPTSHANLSRVTSPANFSCQLVESYFTCQLLMPTCRELLHLLTSHANLSRVTSPAYFSCQLFGCYLILLKAQANLSGVTSLS